MYFVRWSFFINDQNAVTSHTFRLKPASCDTMYDMWNDENLNAKPISSAYGERIFSDNIANSIDHFTAAYGAWEDAWKKIKHNEIDFISKWNANSMNHNDMQTMQNKHAFHVNGTNQNQIIWNVMQWPSWASLPYYTNVLCIVFLDQSNSIRFNSILHCSVVFFCFFHSWVCVSFCMLYFILFCLHVRFNVVCFLKHETLLVFTSINRAKKRPSVPP